MKKYGVKFYSRAFVILLFIQLIRLLEAGSPTHLQGTQDLFQTYSNIREVYEANETSRFIELSLVIDKELRNDAVEGRNTFALVQRYKQITKLVNSLFQPFNIFIVLVNMTWREENEIKIDDKSIYITSKNLENYAKNSTNKRVDHLQLISGIPYNIQTHLCGDRTCTSYSDKPFFPTFKRYKMCESSVGVISDPYWKSVNLMTGYLARILAHNMGIDMDDHDCICEPGKSCIMSDNLSSENLAWSSCSIKSLMEMVADKPNFPCLNNIPTKSFGEPVCGNYFIEDKEQCDCGGPENCKLNRCCDATTCKFINGASCANGECCDLANCRFHNSGKECRSVSHACDIAEYCDGKSAFCPVNVLKNNGERCSKVQECGTIKLIHDGDVTLCPRNDVENGICDEKGVCKCDYDIFSMCYGPTLISHFLLIIRTGVATGTILILLFTYYYYDDMKKWFSFRNKSPELCSPYASTSINEIYQHPKSSKVVYCTPVFGKMASPNDQGDVTPNVCTPINEIYQRPNSSKVVYSTPVFGKMASPNYQGDVTHNLPDKTKKKRKNHATFDGTGARLNLDIVHKK